MSISTRLNTTNEHTSRIARDAETRLPVDHPPSVLYAPDASLMFGVSAALTTPFGEDGSIDTARLVAHAHAALASACDSVTLFGTTGEGASISASERLQVLRAMIRSGVDPSKVVLAIQSCSPADTIQQAAHAFTERCTTFLIAPPFYFKAVTDDGLFRWFSSVISELRGKEIRVILYHIPQITEVPLSIDLTRRLKSAFPNQVYAVKDSAGDFDNTSALLADARLAVLVGDERHLARATALGAQGTISGLANVESERLAAILETARPDSRVDALVNTIAKYPVIPALKVLVSHRTGDDAWLRVRPPLTELQDVEVEDVARVYDRMVAPKDSD